jgi:hypothetical protein
MNEKEKAGMPDRFPNLSAHTTATKGIVDEDNNSTNFKVKKFAKETNIGYRKYESFDILNKNGDISIYTPNSSEVEKRGHLNIINVVDILEELSDQMKSLQKSHALLRKDLVKAGVLKAV